MLTGLEPVNTNQLAIVLHIVSSDTCIIAVKSPASCVPIVPQDTMNFN